MKTKGWIRTSIGAVALATTLAAFAADTPPGAVDFGAFTPSSSGSEFVEVHIRSNLIGMVAKLAESQEPEVAKLIRGLQLIRVNVIGLDDGNRGEVVGRVQKIRTELADKGWERIVTVQQKTDDIGVYIKTKGEEAIEGLVVTVIEGNGEAILVNIVGNLRPEQLVTVGERFDIEPLKKIGPALKKG